MTTVQRSRIAEMNVARGTVERCAAVRTIASNVFDAREAAGVTRKAMARTLGVTASTLWRKETGGTEFKASELVMIAKLCGVQVGRLLDLGRKGAEGEGAAVNVSEPEVS